MIGGVPDQRREVRSRCSLRRYQWRCIAAEAKLKTQKRKSRWAKLMAARCVQRCGGTDEIFYRTSIHEYKDKDPRRGVQHASTMVAMKGVVAWLCLALPVVMAKSPLPYSLGVRDSLMIAHSFHGNANFGPAGGMVSGQW